MKDLLFFLKLFKPYQLWLLTGVLLALATSLASISLLTLSGWFISSSAIAGILAPDGVAIAFNFMQPAAEIRALAIIRTFARYGERLVTHEATFRILAEIRCWFFKKLIPIAPAQLGAKRSADLLQAITRDIDVLDALYLRLCSPFVVALLGVTAVLLFIAFYSVSISILLCLMILISGILMPGLFHRLAKPSSKSLIEASSAFKVAQIELLQGMADLLVFNAYQRFQTQLLNVAEQIVKTQRKNNQLIALLSAINLFLSQFAVMLVIILGSIAFRYGQLSGAEVAMLGFAALAVFELLAPIQSVITVFTQTRVAASRIRQMAQIKPLITEPEQCSNLLENKDLVFNHLAFRYSDSSEWVLKDICLRILHGRKIAITGNSGAGKSTLLKLLLRQYDPQQGELTLGGVDIKQLHSEQLSTQFSVLSQRTQLFASTIRENLLLAKPSASRSELNQAIVQAGLDKFIAKLPGGIDTWVGENGVKVSGGEGRRIALARVYLKNAPILILDEPTEGLDQQTENEVLNALELISKDKTVIMVTHRLAGLRLVDEVYHLEQGCLKGNN